MKDFIIYFSILFLSLGCRPELHLEEEPFESKIIVEGSIETNRSAIVYLTYNAPFYSSINEEELMKRTIRFAKVTISDGEKEEILTGHYRKEFPFMAYKGNTIIGIPGKTYYLKIEHDGQIITAKTTIPTSVPIIEHTMVAHNDTLNQLFVRFKHNHKENIANYRIFTYIPGLNKDYIPTFPIINIENKPDGIIEMPILKGVDKFGKDSTRIFFHKDQEVFLKFCTIDSCSNLFWNSFNNENLADINMFTGSATELRSNVSSPAIGIWCGYGSSYYKVQ